MSAIATRRRRRQVGEPLADAAVDLGVDDRFQRRARRAVGEHDARRAPARSSDAVGARTSRPNRSATARSPGDPGATASRASWSASIDRARRARRTARGSSDFPVAMPPVSATRIMGVQRERLGAGLGGRERVLQQHRDRQRADAAGHGRQRAGDLRDRRDARRRRQPSRASANVVEPRRARAEDASRRAPRSLDRRRADVDDGGARLDELARDEPGPADRRDQDVGLARRPPADPASSSGRSSPSRRAAAAACAIGLPTISLRPMTTACCPAIAMPERSSISITPDGVHGFRCARPCTSLPTFTGWKPSTSLSGSMASNTRCAASRPIAVRQRRLHQDPVVRVAGVQPLDQREQIVERRGRRQPLQVDPQAGSVPALTLLRT